MLYQLVCERCNEAITTESNNPDIVKMIFEQHMNTHMQEHGVNQFRMVCGNFVPYWDGAKFILLSVREANQ